MEATQRADRWRWLALVTAVALLVLGLGLVGVAPVGAETPPPPRLGLPPDNLPDSGPPLAQYEARARPAGHGGPSAKGDWDGYVLAWPCVVADAGGYRLWYGALNPSGPGYGWQVGTATSGNGTAWAKSAGNPTFSPGGADQWDALFVGQMACLKDGSTYKMWYTGATNGPWHIGYATSADGVAWTRHGANPVFQTAAPGSWEAAEVNDPAVLKDGGLYKMWYVGCDRGYEACGIGYATSPDGIVWTKYAGNPVLAGTPGAWDAGNVWGPAVVKKGTALELWYLAAGGWGRATSSDGVHWTKDAGNPLRPLKLGSSPALLWDGALYRTWYPAGSGDNHGINYAESTDGVLWSEPKVQPVLFPGSAGLLIGVNYSEDWVEGRARPHVPVQIMVADSAGTVKATTSGESNDFGRFATYSWAWDPQPPDIQPGDRVTAASGALTSKVKPVGTLEAAADAANDRVTGRIHADWFAPQTLNVRCEVWENNGPWIDVPGVAAAGGSFACDMGAAGWDLKPGHAVAVSYMEPDGDWVYEMATYVDLMLRVNYGHDWVEGEYEPGHTLWLTATQSDGSTVKATAELQTQPIPWWGGRTGFATTMDDPWDPEQPDLAPGDWIYARMDNGRQATVRIGTIEGTLDLAADTLDGTISAPWFSQTLNARCEVWEENGPGVKLEVDPNGGGYHCDFAAEGWDLQPGDDVAVTYGEPDADQVINMFEGPAPNVHVQKWPEGSNQVADGGRAVFGLRVGNAGQATAETVILTDTLPAGLTYSTDTLPTALVQRAPAGGSSQPVWVLGPLAPGEQVQFHLVAIVDADPGTMLVNQADVDTLYDQDKGNNHAEAQVQVVAGMPDPALGKNIDPGDPTPGQTFTYRLDYNNNGPVASGAVKITDLLPPGVTVESWYSQNGYGLWKENTRGGKLELTAPSIPGNWGDALVVRVRLGAGVPLESELVNWAFLETATDSNPNNNEAERSDWVRGPRWDGGVDKRYSDGSPVAGRTLAYDLHMQNYGNMAARAIVTDTLPPGVTFVEGRRQLPGMDVAFPPRSVEGRTVVWDLGTMEPAEWYDLRAIVALDADLAAGTVLTNCAEIGIDGADGSPFNDESCRAETVRAAGPNLRLKKEARWEGDGTLRYEVRIENIGSRSLDNQLVVDTYPADTVFDGNWYGWGPWVTMTHELADRQVIFWVDYLNPGDTAGAVFWVDLKPGVKGQQGKAFVNQATAAVPGDVYPADNTAQATAYSGPDLFAEKWLHSGTPKAGERLTFLVRAGNGNQWPWQMSEGAEARLTERLPTGMTYVSATWPDGNPFDPWFEDPATGTYVWELGRLGATDWRWFYLTVDLDPDLKPGQELVNRLEIKEQPALDIDPVPGNNSFDYRLRLVGQKIYLPLVLRNE